MPQLQSTKTRYIVALYLDEQIKKIASKIGYFSETYKELKIDFTFTKIEENNVQIHTRIEYSPKDRYPIYIMVVINLKHDRMISTEEREKIKKKLIELEDKIQIFYHPCRIKEIIKRNKIHYPCSKELKDYIFSLKKTQMDNDYFLKRLEKKCDIIQEAISQPALKTLTE